MHIYTYIYIYMYMASTTLALARARANTHTHTHMPPFFPWFIFLFPSTLRPFCPVDSAGDLIPTESGTSWSAQLVRSRDVRDVLLPGPSLWSFVAYHSFPLSLPSGLYPFCVSICWMAQSFVSLRPFASTTKTPNDTLRKSMDDKAVNSAPSKSSEKKSHGCVFFRSVSSEKVFECFTPSRAHISKNVLLEEP